MAQEYSFAQSAFLMEGIRTHRFGHRRATRRHYVLRMWAPVASLFRGWFGTELPVGGRRIYVADDDEWGDSGGKLSSPIDRALKTFLRNKNGRPLEDRFIRAFPLADKKIALAAIVKHRSRFLGFIVLTVSQRRHLLTEIGTATSEEALNDLAQRFQQRWHETNSAAYIVLRKAASATVL